MENAVCFVQFIHPGGEHRPDDDGRKEWNRGPHRRKFLRGPGRLIRGGRHAKGDLHFWSEWEPESEVLHQIGDPVPGGPRFIWRPWYTPKRDASGLQNTDPFVFGAFHYTGCQQHAGGHPNQLRHLDCGSVVLFGSHVGGDFVLDTVFVVHDWRDHDASGWRRDLNGLVSTEYTEVTLEPWYARPEESGEACGARGAARSYRLYFGATVENPVEGMFSYFPCTPADETPRGFARPRIRIAEAITPLLRQGKRLNRQSSAASCIRLWGAVRAQVEAKGLALGVHADIPPRVV